MMNAEQPLDADGLASAIAADVMGNDHLRHLLGEQQCEEVHGDVQSIVLRHLRAYLAASPATGEVTVKPLEWEESNEGYAKGQWFSMSIFGEYCTYMHNPSGRAWLQGPDSLGQFCDTIDQAKAAAQSDFEARILSALSAPTPAAPADGLVEPVAWVDGKVLDQIASGGRSEKAVWLWGEGYADEHVPLYSATALASAEARAAELEKALDLVVARGCDHCADSIRQARAILQEL